MNSLTKHAYYKEKYSYQLYLLYYFTKIKINWGMTSYGTWNFSWLRSVEVKLKVSISHRISSQVIPNGYHDSCGIYGVFYRTCFSYTKTLLDSRFLTHNTVDWNRCIVFNCHCMLSNEQVPISVIDCLFNGIQWQIYYNHNVYKNYIYSSTGPIIWSYCMDASPSVAKILDMWLALWNIHYFLWLVYCRYTVNCIQRVGVSTN